MEIHTKGLQMLRRLVACVLFLVVFAMLLTRVERLLMEVNGDRAVVAHEGVPENSVDVVFIGSSHVYGAVIPQKLMDDQGIASVNAASGNQRLWQSVYELEWLLQRQKPRVAVVDLFSLGWVPRGVLEYPELENSGSYYSFLGLIPRALPWTNPLKYTVLVREAMLDRYAPPYLSTIGVRHSKFWDLSRTDFLKAQGMSISSVMFNYSYLYEIYNEASQELPLPDKNAMLPAFNREELLRLQKLCFENDVSLIWTGIPYCAGAEWLGMMEKAHVLASEQGVAFVGMDTIVNESGFDFRTDMADDGHVNYSGAQKVTDFWGEYLKSNYTLPDRREDPAPRYDAWKKRAYQYEAYATGTYMKYVKHFDEWVNEANNLNEDYWIILATNQLEGSITEENVNTDIISLCNVLGLESMSDFLYEQGGFFAIMEGTNVLEEQVTQGDLAYSAIMHGQPLTLRTKHGQELEIKLDNVNIACGHEGLNIILYDKVECRIITASCLSFTQKGIAFQH